MSFTKKRLRHAGIKRSQIDTFPVPATIRTLSSTTTAKAMAFSTMSATNMPVGPSRLNGASRSAANGGYMNGKACCLLDG
jgi:hypothetical protein